jgi:hypothetical protein
LRSLDLVEQLFASDPMRLDAWAAVLDERAHLRLGARPGVIGREGALCEIDSFFRRISGFGFEYRELWKLRDAVWIETDVAAGAAVAPCAIVFRCGRWPLIQDVRFYVDLSALPG